MKKAFLFLMLTVVSFSFVGCSSDDDDDNAGNSMSEAQKKALFVFNGTFEYVHEVGTTTITFKEQYNPAKVVVLDENYATGEGRERKIHGLLTVTYYNGQSFDKYYYIDHNATSIGLSFTETGNRTYSNLLISSPTEFKMKGSNDLRWEVFKK
ncbi:hypothetical protein [Dysgonomonas macrotermitis]|nr:hypothetical protein [Dysgonomonas macrotermitis]